MDMCTILLEQFNGVFTMPLPNKQLTDPESFFSVESITSQDDEVFLTNIIINESIIIDSIKELSSNPAAPSVDQHLIKDQAGLIPGKSCCTNTSTSITVTALTT